MPGTFSQKFNQCLDLFFPPRCVHCNTPNSWLCERCFKEIDFISKNVCIYCGTPTLTADSSACKQCKDHPLQYIDAIRVAAYFKDNPIQSTIHVFKYKNRKVMASVLGEILAKSYQYYNLKADVIVPVPLHPAKFKKRGYNQSELLAKHLCDLVNVPLNRTSLQRIRETKTQMELGSHERRQNVANAFVCMNEALLNKKVLVIDDVCTSGSTLDFCAAALKAGQVASVWGLTLAKAR